MDRPMRTTPDPSTPTYKAMKMYRNYDGSRSTFGDTSVSCTAPNPDNVSAFAVFHATHTGPFRGIPPTGKSITQTGIAITRMRDSQMVENWNETDDLGMLQQLGVIPS